MAVIQQLNFDCESESYSTASVGVHSSQFQRKRKRVSRKGAGGAKEERKELECGLLLEASSLRLCAFARDSCGLLIQ
jgi:hypothetical protein